MIKNEIKMVAAGNENFDKMQIALAIRNSTLNDEISCSLLEEEVIKSCEICNLKCICEGIGEVVEECIEETTNIVSSFKGDQKR